MWGKEGLCNIGQKRNKKKKKKNLSLLACLQMQAMAVAGLVRLEALRGKAWGWGFVAQHKAQHMGDVSHLCSKEKTLGVEV